MYSGFPNEADRQKLVTTIRVKNGGERRIDLTTVPSNAWSAHRDVASDGTDVQSIESLQPSNSVSVVLRTSDDRSKFIIANRSALEVFCRQFLVRQGYGVSDTKARSDRT